MADARDKDAGPSAWIVGRCDVALWGLDSALRWRRCLGRAGVTDCHAEPTPIEPVGNVLLVRADAVVQESLVQALVASPGTVLALSGGPGTPAGGPCVPLAAHVPAELAGFAVGALRRGHCEAAEFAERGLAVSDPIQLGSSYDHGLRKRAAPFAMLVTAGAAPEIERRMFAASYKGVTDLVTKWLWPVPARWVTGWAARRRISANTVTWLSLASVILAWWFFAVGEYAAGLAAAWLMTFLDTVDGKLARVTLTSSKFGDVLDHGIDLLHPPFWYVAWWQGLAGPSPALAAAMWIVVIGYVLGRVIEGWFIWRFKIEIHAWRPIDSRFRLITARRNPNLILLMAAALFGRPDIGLVAVAAWTVLSLVFHMVRVGQAEAATRRGSKPRSWLTEPAPPA
jgi:phosphatidylglycerophosphate synthase